MELAAEYAPQNFYCFTLDKKSKPVFKQRIRNLAGCFHNVFVSENEFDTNSYGKNINYAMVECLNILVEYNWFYVFVLQNHDVILRTNYELVHILKSFNGSNDIGTNSSPMERVNTNLDWSFAGLRLYRPWSMFSNYLSNGYSPRLKWAKGTYQSTLSKYFVDRILYDMDLTRFLAQLEGRFGIDEMFLPTFQTTEDLRMPGGYTHVCIDRGIRGDCATRYSVWTQSPHLCHSKIWRHKNCIFGFEDLPGMKLFPHFFANKLMPEHDFGAIICWHEYMFNRTHVEFPTLKNLNMDFYLSLPHIRFYRELMKNRVINLSTFDCQFKYLGCMEDLSCLDIYE